jgi:hypothetical protein
MDIRSPEGDNSVTKGEHPFFEWIQEFARVGQDERIFPKICRVCGKTFHNLPEYFCATVPRGHCLDDCRRMGKRPFMMLYRHCNCANTLVISLYEDVFPELDRFWKMLETVAHDTGKPLTEVVSDFVVQCDCYLLARDNPCKPGGAIEPAAG